MAKLFQTIHVLLIALYYSWSYGRNDTSPKGKGEGEQLCLKSS